MDKHEAMILQNKVRSNEKVNKAISVIKRMVQEDQQVVVSELVKKTGFARSFFYNNTQVKEEISKAHKLQEGKSYVVPQKVVIDKAMDKEVELLKRKLTEKDNIIENLRIENAKLQKFVEKKTEQIIVSL